MRLSPKTNQQLEASATLYRNAGWAYAGSVEVIEELLDRRRAMGYEPAEPAPDPDAEAAREQRRKAAADYIQQMHDDDEPKEPR